VREPSGSDRTPSVRTTRLSRLSLGQWFGLSSGVLLVVASLGFALALLSLFRLADARTLLADRLDPAATSALRFNAAMINEETGVRGFLLAGREEFLEPWTEGRREQAAARRALERFADSDEVRQLRADLAAVERAAAEWERAYAEPTIEAVRREGRPAAGEVDLESGRARFDSIRGALGSMQGNLQAARKDARESLRRAATTVLIAVIAFGVLALAAVLAATGTLRAVAVRPLRTLAAQVRRVARGEFERSVGVDAGREIVQLGDDIDSMRRRILDEVDALQLAQRRLEQQAQDLQRSNAELEQFAYVASHDLQEPLRKVASFCQLLQSRYGGQLDDRADQYIEFAVDGAKRMQELINDLLAFSRVNRVSKAMTEVDCNAVVRAAESNLAARVEDSGATIRVGELPTVIGDAGLLTLVFQNLIANAIKFRGDAAPEVRVDARRDGDCWEFTCADNGIGIEAEYAERIFVIFQRLHSRATYEGTGIGLAMCRKIVEFHGGRIWLSSNGDAAGSAFRFTLPSNAQETRA
jgi:signal transduction histidine kinase